MTRLVFFTLLVFSFSAVIGQDLDNYVYGGVSANGYNGDASGYGRFSGIFNAGLRFNRKEKLNGSLNLSIGSITSSNIDFNPSNFPGTNRIPNSFFETSFFSFHYQLQYNLIKKENLIVYVGQGIGFIRFNPKDDLNNNLQDIPETRAQGEEYTNISLMLPTSVGVVYILPNGFGFGFNTTLYNPLTDYLDNISDLGTDEGNDNMLAFGLSMYVPLKRATE
ncbi:MAG: hypothetical protein AAFX87_05125 [Bacteroidota bacterium]